jgi:hypothetical protein
VEVSWASVGVLGEYRPGERLEHLVPYLVEERIAQLGRDAVLGAARDELLLANPDEGTVADVHV